MKKKISAFLIVLTAALCFFSICSAQNEGTKILNKVSQGTTRICTKYACGTGFFINEKQIVTNHHVVSTTYQEFEAILEEAKDPNAVYEEYFDAFWFSSVEGNYVEVIFSDVNNDSIYGMVTADWPELDLAVVEVEEAQTKRTPLKLSNSDHIVQGMNLYVVGFPGVMGRDYLTKDNAAITGGILSKIQKASEGLNLQSTPYNQLVFDSTVNSGNSGGPIVDSNGNVIGIVTSKSNPLVGIAYFGVQVDELTAKLGQRGYKYTEATFGNGLVLWIIIGVLAAAITALAVILLRRRKNHKKVDSTPKTITPADKTAPNISIQGIAGQFSGIKKPLSFEKDCIIGTDPSVCTVVFEKSERTVSGRHCRIHYSKSHQRFIIQDLGSTNGTILVRGSSQRNVPAKSGLALDNGDVIYIPDKKNAFRVNL